MCSSQQHESKKQKLIRAVQEEKAGLERSDMSVRLHQDAKPGMDSTAREAADLQSKQVVNELLARGRAASQIASAAAKKEKKRKRLSNPDQRNAVRKQKRGMFVFDDVEDEADDNDSTARTPTKKRAEPGIEYMESSDSYSDDGSEEDAVPLKTASPGSQNGDDSPPRPKISGKALVPIQDIVAPTAAAPTRVVSGGGFSIPVFKAASSDGKRSKPQTSLSDALLSNPFSAAAPTTLGVTEVAAPALSLDPAIQQQLHQAHEAKLAAMNQKKATASQLSSSAQRHPAYYVLVDRSEEIQNQRSELPITMEEQQIVEKILENDVVIICGETGSGKTTQLPQFLYEAGFGDPKSRTPGMVGVTEPRRVAAVSTAQRVAVELNQRSPSLDETEAKQKNRKKRDASDQRTEHVSFQIRYDSTCHPDTRIKFMTDGILLREIQNDFLLSRYSSIIVDEAHERTMNTDVLLGLLCRIVPLRRQVYEEEQRKGNIPDDHRQAKSPLKVIIMSATLRVADFTSNRRMFPHGPPPVISIGSRQYPVTVHFNKKTPVTGYVQEAFKKVVKIHTTLPSGGVLVFLTGQQEVEYLCHKLRSYFEDRLRRLKRGEAPPSDSLLGDDADLAVGGDEEAQDHLPEEERAFEVLRSADDELKNEEPTFAVGDDSGSESEEDAVIQLAESMMNEADDSSKTRAEIKSQKRADKQAAKAAAAEEMATLVLPLYSMLPPQQQMKVFDAVPPNTRLIVVATNIAETSLTIPGISYVVDSGRVKNKVYDKASGMSRYKVEWIAQSAANQRSGRAGRTGPGHSYRLYSSAVFQELPDFPTPDILMIPIEEVVLQMKNMGISKVDSFPFPTPPDHSSLATALATLVNIGAVSQDPKTREQAITPLGKSMARFPVHPRYAKMLILGRQGECIQFIIAIVACLAVGDPFLVDSNPSSGSAARMELWKPFASQTSDLFSALSAIGAYEFAEEREVFCSKYKLHSKTMKEIRMLRWQLTNLLNQQKLSQISDDLRLQPPSRDQKVLLRQVLAAGFVDHIARRVPDTNEAGEEISGKWKYVTGITSQEAHIHPSSFLYKIRPEWVVYRELFETNRVYLKGVSAVLLDWMTSLGPWLCSGMDDIVESPGPRYDSEKDRIRGFVQPAFIHKDWLTSKLPIDLKGLDAYKNFARFFLEGQICKEMKPFVKHLIAKPSIITKQWAQQKIAAILQPLLDHKIDTKQKLLARWEKDPKFWLSGVSLWVDAAELGALGAVWPPSGKKR